ncbi:flagellar hook-length control protein FliK [Sandarakinorhabdus sp. AAP62]|uniref:flagellar hook-length control protein FliK n=1 Tax=Sandarakinorhabdus sp. AAP62 TaxID=1248916 RepID=UPI0002E4A4C1|nr:flagellar hook-length control protein FliK [Sandarakinorhabdus sp. AAP62]
MLNLPSPQTALPFDLAAPVALPVLMPADWLLPPVVPPDEGALQPVFAGLLAAQGPQPPVAADPLETAPEALESAEPAAITQAWALVLVPELANLPAELAPPASPLPAAPVALSEPAPETSAVAGDAASRSAAVLNDSGASAWPKRAFTSPRLAGLPLAADPGRVRGWQNGLPSGPAPAAATATPSPALPFILRNVTGQPIPFPTADQPPWYDPHVPPPWFDPANPPPAWSDPTQPAPLWYDPTKLPPAWLDPARVPAAWFDALRPPSTPGNAVVVVPPAPSSPAVTLPALPAPAAPSPVAAITPPPVPATVTDGAAPPVLASVAAPVPTPAPALTPGQAEPALPPITRRAVVAAPIRAEGSRRAAIDEQPALVERPQPSASLPAFALALPPTPAQPANPAFVAAAPAPAATHAAETNPALTIASDRLGDVAVRLSGGPEQLQVTMQAQPAAAALIGADAPRLSQDLAAAGVALAGLSVNGQRADLSGGGRERQRQPSRRNEDAPIAAARRLVARPALNRPVTVDRFA